jgi:hypothetical protein
LKAILSLYMKANNDAIRESGKQKQSHNSERSSSKVERHPDAERYSHPLISLFSLFVPFF